MTPYVWKEGAPHADKLPSRKTAKKLRVAVLDCGVKYNILRLLENNGCEVLVLPASSSGKDVLADGAVSVFFKERADVGRGAG